MFCLDAERERGIAGLDGRLMRRFSVRHAIDLLYEEAVFRCESLRNSCIGGILTTAV